MYYNSRKIANLKSRESRWIRKIAKKFSGLQYFLFFFSPCKLFILPFKCLFPKYVLYLYQLHLLLSHALALITRLCLHYLSVSLTPVFVPIICLCPYHLSLSLSPVYTYHLPLPLLAVFASIICMYPYHLSLLLSPVITSIICHCPH